MADGILPAKGRPARSSELGSDQKGPFPRTNEATASDSKTGCPEGFEPLTFAAPRVPNCSKSRVNSSSFEASEGAIECFAER